MFKENKIRISFSKIWILKKRQFLLSKNWEE
ncbi:hypothetical protein LSS_16736 [Leptospira santarosai serovar Shermani str. LT 821]|uniref:Uncharacterized protein n=1 Tax=Leptospira santarosai serovar Shermani str. LT 821 TaxID=758847 RepID=K8Y773_9LEPT|nr:hypothetical protein LSS_16736 [Leptospira santarosai serovar Shermani str. LT 821]